MQFYTTKKPNAFKALFIYRHIQLLTNLSNDIQQKWIIPAPLFGALVGSGAGLAVLVQIPASSENLVILLIMAIIWADFILFLLICLGTFATLYKESKATVQKIKLSLAEISDRIERIWARKFLRSCGALKVKFGANNFVEELTPLNCLSYSLQISVQILLLQRSHK